MTTLHELSNDLTAAVGQAGTSVVRVDGRRRLPASGIVWSADGVIVTAHHVVRREDNLTVGLPDGATVAAELIGRDPTTDIAVLKVDASELAVPVWAESEALQVGEIALALGRPGRSVQAAWSVIHAVGDAWRTPAGGSVDRYVAFDGVMYPGFSGGPLVRADGGFAGMNVSALLRGVSLTLPSGTLRRVVESLLAHGTIQRGYLGVGAQPVALPEALATSQRQRSGLLVVTVEPGSPAEAGGLLLGDTIVRIGDAAITSMDDLLAGLTGDRIGEAVPVGVIRGGEPVTLTVTIGARS